MCVPFMSSSADSRSHESFAGRWQVVCCRCCRSSARAQAAYPALWLREHKFWPVVGRIDNVYGDRNPVCTCASMDWHNEDTAV